MKKIQAMVVSHEQETSYFLSSRSLIRMIDVFLRGEDTIKLAFSK